MLNHNRYISLHATARVASYIFLSFCDDLKTVKDRGVLGYPIQDYKYDITLIKYPI